MLFVTIKEIQVMTGRSERTVHRWLRRRGLSCTEERSISLAELRSKWPAFYNSMMLRAGKATSPACPECGSPTHLACTVCEFSLS